MGNRGTYGGGWIESRANRSPVKFPLTGNKTEKFFGLRAELGPGKFSIPLDMRGLWLCRRVRGLLEQGITDQLSGKDHSLMGTIAQLSADRCPPDPSNFPN